MTAETSSEEVRSLSLPGDELIPFPGKIITHSIIINAPTKVVWPWLVQLGAGRAGWYSHDRIDNGGTPSAKGIIPELQHIEVGDIMPAVPNSKDAFIIREVQIGKALVLVVPIMTAVEDTDTKRRMTGPLRVSWALVLESLNGERTKLISRGRISTDWLTYSRVSNKKPIFIERVYGLLKRMPWFLLQPIATLGHYFMESRMLRGVKVRAEKQMHV
jgi:hypothetical protein